MKRHKNLFPQVYSFANLFQAFKQARRGKQAQATVLAFRANLGEELLTLAADLQAERWQSGGFRSFTVHEPKRRKISAAPFRDRVVHHALCNALIPIYERKFIFDSYANRVGKGTHAALDRCTHFMRRFGYVLQCDVQQFFPAIDHAILKNILAKTIGCPPTLRLCGKIIDSGAGVLNSEYTMRYFPGDDLFSVNRPRGLPIGNLTSQFWANVYLHELDHFVKRTLHCRGYLRYVDDFLLFADDLKTLHEWREQIIIFLQSLRLTLHERRAQPRPTEQGIPFLGFTVYPDHRRLKRAKGIAYQQRLKFLSHQVRTGQMQREQARASVQAWIGHVKHGDTTGLRRSLFARVHRYGAISHLPEDGATAAVDVTTHSQIS